MLANAPRAYPGRARSFFALPAAKVNPGAI
jgi:hypothetical protein